MPRFNKVTKDNVRTHWSMIRSRIIDLTTHHIRNNICCILHFYELHTFHANNEILYFEIDNLSRIITFNEHTYTEHLKNVLRKFPFVKNELLIWINSSFIIVKTVYKCFYRFQGKRLSYPIVYQSYRIVRESCCIVRVFYRIVR